MSKYIIEEQTLSDIADKIREKKYQENEMTPLEMVDEIDEMGLPWTCQEDFVYSIPDPWIRPTEYPDLTVLDISELDGEYLTYDLRKTEGYGWIGIYAKVATTSKLINIERGHIEGTEFVADESFTISNGQYFRQALDDTNGNIQLWKVWTEGHFTDLRFCSQTTVSAESMYAILQPVVERMGRMPYITTMAGNYDTRPTYCSWSTRWMQRDETIDITNVTSMANAYIRCVDLQDLILTGINTSKVTSFSSAFYECHKLRTIPLNLFNTSSATSLASMFYHCYSLDNVDISHFNIDKVTSLAEMFHFCLSLEHLEMSTFQGNGKLTTINRIFKDCRRLGDIERNIINLNVSNVTNFAYAFCGCRKLYSIDLSSWVVNKATDIGYLFSDCYSLKCVNLDGWDVSNVTAASNVFINDYALKRVSFNEWSLDKVASMASFFSSCHNLEETDILTRINYSTVTNLSAFFYYCYSLKEVNFPDMSATNKITTMANMFIRCYSLKRISMPDMDFSYASGVALNAMFSQCRSLTDLDISGWHIVKLGVIGEMFSSCSNLEEIDLSTWTVDDGTMVAKNSVNYVFNGVYSCRSIKVPFALKMVNGSMSYWASDTFSLEYFDIRNWDITESSNFYELNSRNLVEYYPPKLPPKAQAYSSSNVPSLSRASLLRIIDQLPTITTGLKLTLGQVHKSKLTAEEIAVATDKGWVVV